MYSKSLLIFAAISSCSSAQLSATDVENYLVGRAQDLSGLSDRLRPQDFLTRGPGMFELSVSNVDALQAIDVVSKTIIDHYGKFIDEDADVVSELLTASAFTESEQYSICSSVRSVSLLSDTSTAVNRC